MTQDASSNAYLAAARERTMLFDGAMGTVLLAQGLRGPSADYWSIEYPDSIYGVHRSYADLGVDAIETNTFGSGVVKLRKCGLQDLAAEMIAASVSLAKKAAEGRCFLHGAIGPTGELLQPLGSLSRKEAYDNYVEHIGRLITGGVDALLIESMVDLAQTRIALLAANEVRAKRGFFPVLMSMTYNPDGRTMMGDTVEAAACVAEHLRADLAGLNCSAGPNELFPTFKRLVNGGSLPVFAMPNAGLPYVENGETLFPFSSEQMKEAMRPYLGLGAHIGGCCGTTPTHIAALKELVAQTPRVLPPRPDIADRICSTRLTASTRDLGAAARVDLTGLSVPQAVTAVADIEEELAVIDLGTLGANEVDAVLAEALPILQGTILAFVCSSAEQAEPALWLYDGIAAVHMTQESPRTQSILYRYGAVSY